MKYAAGIDLGTTSTKTAIMDMQGRILGIGRGSYDLHIPKPSWAEQEPEKWWSAVKLSLKEACADAGISASEIDGIGFSGQMHGLVALDQDREPVCPAIIHLDQRSGRLLPRIHELAGDLMKEELLNRPAAGMLISSLCWLKENEPGIFRRIRYVMSPKDYIRYRLCGEIGTDVSDASATLAFSVKNREWCAPLFERLQLRGDIWPSVHESSEIAGNVSRRASAETGLSTKTILVYGAGDSLAAMTGCAVIDKGILACNIGTSSQLVFVSDQPVFDPKFRIQTWCHALPERWALQSGTLNGGSTLNWLRGKVLKSGRPFSELDEEAGEIPAGADGLFFLPYLAGERTPYNDPNASGSFSGLRMHHEQAHLVRAVMEGVMFNLKECLCILDGLQVKPQFLISSGGAARGRTWRQIQADMLEMPVHTTKVEEEACQGAAILAAVGAGCYSTVQEACRNTVSMSEEVIEPVPENGKLYREKLHTFRELYLRTKDL